ncbi:MAG: response regulator, partial [Desulfobacteraceae bacterium]
YEKEESDTYSREAIATYRKTRYFFVVIGVIAIIIAVLGAVILTRSIVIPLEQGVFFANKLSEGDFSAEIRIKQHDETGQLLFAMKNMAERLKRTKSLEQQLFQSQKLENVGRLAGGVAHDFNNILTVIRGYSELAILGMAEGKPVRGSLEEVLKASERAGNLTRQLLAFSRRQVMEMKIIDLKCLMKDLEKMLRRLIGEDIDLRMALASDLGRVRADPGQIEQVIVNLAVNARDAMPSGGVLTIEAANIELDEGCSCLHVDAKPGEYVLLCVSDTGTGMIPEVRERVFEPFFTTKEKGKGTGLGLSMAYGIVKQSNGHIWVYSEPNQGTTFKIYLPLAKESAESTGRKEEVTALPRGKETILLVEDESSVRLLAARVLRDQGYTIHEAPDGTEALHFMQRNGGGSVDLLLTDVIMPKLNGKELSEHLKTINPKLRVLFTSGYTDDVIAHHGVLEDGTNFIQKPYTSAALTTKVREVLSKGDHERY